MAKPILRDESAYDAGTMWTMRRHGRTARCALLSLAREWELRVLVDGQPLLARRCLEAKHAHEVAEEWKRRMAEKGWSQVRPPFPLRVA
jgi:hypothetical protein